NILASVPVHLSIAHATKDAQACLRDLTPLSRLLRRHSRAEAGDLCTQHLVGIRFLPLISSAASCFRLHVCDHVLHGAQHQRAPGVRARSCWSISQAIRACPCDRSSIASLPICLTAFSIVAARRDGAEARPAR